MIPEVGREILEVFRAGGDEFAAAVDGMTESCLESLIDGLRPRVSDACESLDYCKMLFSNRKTRKMGLLLCVQLLQGNRFSDKAAFRCVPDMKTAIIDCSAAWEVESDEGAEAAGHCIAFLRQLCKEIIGFLLDSSEAHADTDAGNSQFHSVTSMAGYIKALDLLPSALHGLENLNFPSDNTLSAGEVRSRDCAAGTAATCRLVSLGMSAVAVRSSVIAEVLASRWPSTCVFPLLKVLLDVSLTDAEKSDACKHVIDHNTDIPDEHTIGLIEILFSTAEKYGDMGWLEAGRIVLERTPESLLADAYCVVEISLHNGSRLMGLLHDSLELLGAGEEQRAGKRGAAEQSLVVADCQKASQLSTTYFYLMLITAQNELFRERVIDTMISELAKLPNAKPGDLSGQGSGLHSVKALLSKVARLPEAEKYSSLLLEVGLRLLSDGSQGKSVLSHEIRSSSAVGQHLLCDLFCWSDHVRAELMATLFNTVVENQRSDSRFLAACVQVLQRITALHLLSLRGLADTIVQCLSLLWLLPLPLARTLLRAFLPLSKHSQQFCDRIMVLFRKELYGTDVQKRRLAVYGVCLLMSHIEPGMLFDLRQQLDIIVSLKPIFSSHLDVRQELYHGLQALLSEQRPDAGYNALHEDAKNLLKELLMSRIRRYFFEKGSTSASAKSGKGKDGLGKDLEMRIEPCFEESGTAGAPRLSCKENLSQLFRCIAKLARMDKTAQAVMQVLSEQLSCPSSVAKLMTGYAQSEGQEGRDRIMCLTPNDRLMILLPIYEILIDFCAGENPPPWAIPSFLVRTSPGTPINSELWLHIFSTLAVISPTLQDCGSDADSEGMDIVLASIESIVRGVSSAPVDNHVARNRCLKLSPIICRLVRRLLDLGMNQELVVSAQSKEKDVQEVPSSSSFVHVHKRSSATTNRIADVAPRLLACMIYLFKHTQPPLGSNSVSHHKGRVTRSTAQRDVEVSFDKTVAGGAAEIHCGSAAKHKVSEVVYHVSRSFVMELVFCFQDRKQGLELNDDDSVVDERCYHKMRDLLLDAIRACILSGGCSARDLWLGLGVKNQGAQDTGELVSVQVVEKLCLQLDAEVDLGVLPISTFVAYLDLIQAVYDRRTTVDAVGPGTAWSNVCKRLMSIMGRSCQATPVQALRRVLSFSIKTLEPSAAIALSAQVILHWCNSIQDDDSPTEDLQLSFMLGDHLNWKLPEFDIKTRMCAVGMSLKHLCATFAAPVNLKGSMSVILHAATVVSRAFKLTSQVSSGERALFIRLSRRILFHSTKLCAALLCFPALDKILLHAALLFTRQALLGADSLCGSLDTESSVRAAQIRHDALRCGLQAKDLISVARVQLLVTHSMRDILQELDDILKALQQGNGEEQVQVVTDSAAMAPARTFRKKRRRLRSRNAYVDAFLGEEDGSDGFGDLEDFIVCGDETEF